MNKHLQTYIEEQFTKGSESGQVIAFGRQFRVDSATGQLQKYRQECWVETLNDECWQIVCRLAIDHYWPIESTPAPKQYTDVDGAVWERGPWPGTIRCVFDPEVSNDHSLGAVLRKGPKGWSWYYEDSSRWSKTRSDALVIFDAVVAALWP